MSSDIKDSSDVQIKIRKLYKIFGENSQKALELSHKGYSREQILKKTGCAIGVANANFDIYRGETLVVMGLSGSGKSTLLRCLNRLISPTAGEIEIDGQSITQMTTKELLQFRRKKFGMVFQHFGLFPNRTVLRNAEYGLEIQKVPKAEREQKAREALNLVGLEGWEEYRPNQLSGGMQQRVGLARALAVDPDILLMDEAFSALDPLIRVDMQDELLSLESQVNKTIVFITHDLDEALKMGDRIVLMKDGEIVQIGTPDQILNEPANEYVRKFVENVDLTKVLTASDVMKKTDIVISKKDGPKMALRVMKEKDLNGIYVTEKNKKLVGYLTVELASKAVKEGKQDFEGIIDPVDDYIVELNTPIKSIFKLLHDSDYPVPVVDDDRRLKGVIWYGSMTAALAEHGNFDFEEDSL
ncbi:MAG: glycine betaine/L-proline ABC transporter ATP-binding protein [Spirochaetales bacterium]|nr:glycine betaine/L-proline ABC transporter ATP-binding protein [Spirochaetales bacterium]